MKKVTTIAVVALLVIYLPAVLAWSTPLDAELSEPVRVRYEDTELTIVNEYGAYLGPVICDDISIQTMSNFTVNDFWVGIWTSSNIKEHTADEIDLLLSTVVKETDVYSLELGFNYYNMLKLEDAGIIDTYELTAFLTTKAATRLFLDARLDVSSEKGLYGCVGIAQDLDLTKPAVLELSANHNSNYFIDDSCWTHLTATLTIDVSENCSVFIKQRKMLKHFGPEHQTQLGVSFWF